MRELAAEGSLSAPAAERGVAAWLRAGSGEGGGWRAAAHLLPEAWVEREHAAGEAFEARRSESLRYASRRRREPEAQAVLASRPLPQAHAEARTEPCEAGPAADWPDGAPARPVHQAQLFADCVQGDGGPRSADLDEINRWLRVAAAAMRALEAEDDARAAVEAAEAALQALDDCAAQPRQHDDAMRRARATSAVRAAKERQRALPRPVLPEKVVTYGVERLAPWAREHIWCCEDPADCVPVRPSTAADPPPCEVNRDFFEEWGERLGCIDHDMLEQVASGVAGRSACEHATVLRFHHKGLQANFAPARKSIEADAAPDRAWISQGKMHLQYVPARLVARNCLPQHKWKEAPDGTFFQVLKWRVTTDDSIEEPEQAASRNAAMPRDEWPELSLPTPGLLAEAVAILKAAIPEQLAASAAQALAEAGIAGEEIVLWALDLSDACDARVEEGRRPAGDARPTACPRGGPPGSAGHGTGLGGAITPPRRPRYRKLAVQRLELWQQCFIWSDGCRVDRRCLFGAAHMVQIFERVSSFVLRVVRVRQEEYDRLHPHSAPRRAWAERRAEAAGTLAELIFSMVYIDVSAPAPSVAAPAAAQH